MKLSDLKALFWKEWHENLRWAILALLALSVGLAYAEYRQPSNQTLNATWADADLVLTLMGPLIGLAFGLLQILPELRRDQWAFLVHRPVSRTTLFFGKVIPGVCLYGLATIPPLLGFALWASFPSHVPAPFDFRFTLAGWAAICSGLPFYFAGLLVALRPARWYGSRALPILMAILAPLAANMFNVFLPVMLVCLFISGIMLYTAWGSFVTDGEYEEQTKPARFALGLTLYSASVCVGIATLFLVFAVLNALSGTSQEWWRNEQNIDTQGHLYEHDEHSDSRGHVTTTITDETGKTVDPRVWGNLSSRHKLLTPNYLYSGRFSQRNYRYSEPDCYVPSLTSTENDRYQTDWYYETAAHQIVGYTLHKTVGFPIDTSFPSIISYLGPNGFGRNRAQVGQFEKGQPYSVGFAGYHLLRFPHAVYSYNPEASVPSIHLLQTLPGGSAGTTLLTQTKDGFVTNGGNEDTAQILIITAGAHMTVYSSVPDKMSKIPSRLFTLTAPADPKIYSDIQVAVLPDHSRFFFWYQTPSRTNAGRLITVTSNGRIINNQTLPATHGLYIQPSLRFVQTAPAVMVPPVGICVATLYGYIGHALKNEAAESWWQGLDSAALVFGALFFSALGGLVAAVLGWLVSRRCGDSRRGQIAWAVGVFWLGLYGVLLLLALRAWPARVSCPNCGRLRVVDRTECEHCGAQFARPQRDGTEIFDDAEEAGVR